jgi:C-terminal processing protease CtpA/Prc
MACFEAELRNDAGASKQQLGYVRLATFNSNTTAAAQQAFEQLSKQGVAGLVLDIRNNGGGLFPAGVMNIL